MTCVWHAHRALCFRLKQVAWNCVKSESDTFGISLICQYTFKYSQYINDLIQNFHGKSHVYNNVSRMFGLVLVSRCQLYYKSSYRISPSFEELKYILWVTYGRNYDDPTVVPKILIMTKWCETHDTNLFSRLLFLNVEYNIFNHFLFNVSE